MVQILDNELVNLSNETIDAIKASDILTSEQKSILNKRVETILHNYAVRGLMTYDECKKCLALNY